MASIFKGAVLESEQAYLEEVTQNAIDNLDKMKNYAQKYSEGVLGAADHIARIIKDQMK